MDKKFANEITTKELNSLEYIKWSLDRIEDAKYGMALDNLEAYVDRYEGLLGELNKLSFVISRHLPSKNKKK